MPFLIRHHDGTQNQVFHVIPSPTEVDYPSRREQTIRKTKDNVVVIQRPVRDGRERMWRWMNYPQRLTTYANMWDTLQTFEVKDRLDAGLDPLVEVWEDVTGMGFGETDDGQAPDLDTYSNLTWTKVRAVEVDREIREGGGLVVYAVSEMRFYIEDDNWSRF